MFVRGARMTGIGATFLLASAVFWMAACVAGPGSHASGPTASFAGSVPSGDLGAIRDAIFAQYQPNLVEVGIGTGYVEVGLASTARKEADEILATYGSLVHVTLGFFPYPAPSSALGNGCTTAFGGWPTVDPHSLRATIERSAGYLTHARGFSAKVRLTNTGTAPLAISTGSPLLIYLFELGGAIPVGASSGGVAGVGIGRTLKAGEYIDIDAGGGTSSCDLKLGYELPDGPYIAKAAVELDQPGGPGYFWSDPLAVELRSDGTGAP
jgi:hypothetical protein